MMIYRSKNQIIQENKLIKNYYQKNNRLKIGFNRLFMAAEIKSQVKQFLSE